MHLTRAFETALWWEPVREQFSYFSLMQWLETAYKTKCFTQCLWEDCERRKPVFSHSSRFVSKDAELLEQSLLSGKNSLSLGIIYQLIHLPVSPSDSENKISSAFLHLWKKPLVLVCCCCVIIAGTTLQAQGVLATSGSREADTSLLQMESDHFFQKWFRTKAQDRCSLSHLKELIFLQCLQRIP